MTLREYLDIYEVSTYRFGKNIGVPQSVVYRWATGETLPAWKNIPLIVWATGGEVMAEDFVPYQLYSFEGGELPKLLPNG